MGLTDCATSLVRCYRGLSVISEAAEKRAAKLRRALIGREALIREADVASSNVKDVIYDAIRAAGLDAVCDVRIEPSCDRGVRLLIYPKERPDGRS